MGTLASPPPWILLCLATLAMSILTGFATTSSTERKVYIVYMGAIPTDLSTIEMLHSSMLSKVTASIGSEHLVRSYKRSINGFAARLTSEEAKTMASMENVVSVFPSINRKLLTTRSWNFMGFPLNASRATFESDVIIGIFDTGVWPESESFSDKGFGPPPAKWKGNCQSSSNFTCNNKIIGAKFYHSAGPKALQPGDIPSPRDSEGHGSHTASTAAGRLVIGASLYGIVEGTARGGVPSARIAVYKICWSLGCSDTDILAAFDDAIADGVDIISLSLGGSFPSDYFEDSIAIGAFHAMKAGVLTSNSAGNSGPSASTVVNISPWSLTVAASSIDPKIIAGLKLGNGNTYEGSTINTFTMNNTLIPLVYGGNCPNTSAGYDESTSRYCSEGSLDTTLVKGKIVLCDAQIDTSGPLLAGAAGTIMQTNGYTDYSFSFPMPATELGSHEGAQVSIYINKTSKPTATILKSQTIADSTAPTIASFSSRGPNPITADILKPDLTAPGVDILAAWSPLAPFSAYKEDKRSVPYNIISGTSMSCPHATGAAAYVMSFHPTWSPAAIKSALMTTAYPMKVSANPDAEFAYGSGHINPVAASSPGLVYDAGEADYVSMLCGQGYSTKSLRLVSGDKSTCTSSNNGTVWDLNYPSFALSIESGSSFSKSYKRTVTNVGLPSSTYKVTVNSPPGLTISIEPTTIIFKSLLEKKSYLLTVAGKATHSVVSASIVWDDGVHRVRSPIVVYTSDQS